MRQKPMPEHACRKSGALQCLDLIFKVSASSGFDHPEALYEIFDGPLRQPKCGDTLHQGNQAAEFSPIQRADAGKDGDGRYLIRALFPGGNRQVGVFVHQVLLAHTNSPTERMNHVN